MIKPVQELAEMEKIVILDGYTANPGDLSWDEFEKLGILQVFERTAPEEVLQRCEGASMVLTNKVVLNRETLLQLPLLKYIGVLATGYNVVDVKTATENGIIVTNIPGYSTDSVVQHTFALILSLASRVTELHESVQQGGWVNSPDFAYWNQSLTELSGLRLGIVGLGSIGIAVSKVANALGMEVVAYTRTPKNVEGVKSVSFEELIETSDVVTLHCPLTEQTHHLINSQTLLRMKPSAMLINTGRGPLVDEDALATALNNGQIAGVGLDVLSSEPPLPENPLLRAKNCIITPHVAWASTAARKRLIAIATQNLEAYLNGNPKNQVS